MSKILSGGNAKHCFIATGDDGIVLKPIGNEIRSVKISDCVIASYANCFKIGTETLFDVTDIAVENCRFFLPDGTTGGYAGLAIESADGSNISNVVIKNIEMDGISSPLLIWLGSRFKYDNKEVGSIDNISITNVKAVNTELPCAITGCRHRGKTYDVTNIRLSNIDIRYRDTNENLSVRKRTGMYAMSGYPEITRVSHIYFLSHEASKYWDLPCYGIFVRNAKGVEIDGFSVAPRSANKRAFAALVDTDAML